MFEILAWNLCHRNELDGNKPPPPDDCAPVTTEVWVYRLRTIVARKTSDGITVAVPVGLHSFTPTVSPDLTRIVPMTFAGRRPGQPGATESPTFPPVTTIVSSLEHDAGETVPKFSVAVPVR